MTRVLIKVRNQDADTQSIKDHEKTEVEDGYLTAKERDHGVNQFC